MSSSDVKQTVLVTGSSGFLGQHVVKLLQENDKTVKEIRCLDIKPYTNTLGHSNNVAMKVMTGDITDERTVLEACRDVDVIIHCAAVIDLEFYPDDQKMKRVNVDGTSNLITGAIESGTRYLIFVSTVDVVIGDDPIYFGAENTTPIPKKHVLAGYAKTKLEAELLVKKANNKPLSDGTGNLRTVILRPSLMYGEGDPYFISQTLKITKEDWRGKLQRVDNIFTRCQVSYAGNVAWACLKAKERMQEDPSIGGEEFFITDDTPILDPYDFLKPYLEDHGMTVSNWSLPFWILIFFMSILVFVVKIIRPLYAINLPKSFDVKKIKYLSNTYFFNRNKAILRLDYDPLFSPEECESRSHAYYKKLPL